MACSRPAPGPLTFTSSSITPCLRACWAACSAARPAANGVLLRAPLKPTVPADAQARVSPLVSVMVTIVLLNVALMWATPRVTPLRMRFLTPALAPVWGFAPPPPDCPDDCSAMLFFQCGPAKRTLQKGCRAGVPDLLAEFLHALLAGDGLARTLTGAGVGAGALAANGERAAMTMAAIAADVAQAGDVLLDRAAQSAFDQKALVDEADDLRQFLFGEVLGAPLAVDACFLEHLSAVGSANAVDVGQADPDRLVGGNVHARDTRHSCSNC